MILKSRTKYETSEKFRDEFLETLTPGVIPRSDFIKWESIKKKEVEIRNFFFFL